MTLVQRTLKMPGTPHPKRKKELEPNERHTIYHRYGTSSIEGERVIRSIRKHVPNRFAEMLREYQIEEFYDELTTDEEYEDQDGARDLSGFIQLEGKKTPVCTGYMNEVEIWHLDDESPDWPTCQIHQDKLEYGWFGWRCHTCDVTKQVQKDKYNA